MTLLKPLVLLDVMEVITSQDYSPLHLLALDDPSEDSAADTHVPGKGALLVNIGPFSGLVRQNRKQLNSHVPGKGALLVNIGPFSGLVRQNRKQLNSHVPGKGALLVNIGPFSGPVRQNRK